MEMCLLESTQNLRTEESVDRRSFSKEKAELSRHEQKFLSLLDSEASKELADGFRLLHAFRFQLVFHFFHVISHSIHFNLMGNGMRRFLWCDLHARPADRFKQLRRLKLGHHHVHSVLTDRFGHHSVLIDRFGHQLGSILLRQFLAKRVLVLEAL
jgi:hypothetical protein